MAKVRDLNKAIQYLKAKMPQAGFFSTLDELIQNSPQAQMPADQWQNYLRPGRVFNREGVNFPLKQEEIDYSGLPSLFKTFGPEGLPEHRASLDLLHNSGNADAGYLGVDHGEKAPLSREMVLNHARRNRPEFNVHKYVTDPDLPYNGEERLARHMPEETQMIDESHPNWQIAPRSHPVVQDARYSGYAHKAGVPNSYEENVTTSPDFGTFNSHFGNTDLSWSRTTRHHMDDTDFGSRNVPGFEGKGPTARLVEEIQSDRHEAAAEKVPRWSDEDPDTEVRREPFGLEIAHPIEGYQGTPLDPSDMQRRGYRSPGEEAHLAEISHVHRPAREYANLDAFRRELEAKPPDTPFKDPVDYALLELKKQMLNSANQGDRYLALTRGADQAERYAQDPAKALGMSHVYDKVYPSALNKLARQYGAPVRDIDIPMSQKNNLKPDAFANLGGVDTAEEYHNLVDDFDNPDDYKHSLHDLIDEYQVKLPEVGNKRDLISSARHWLNETHKLLLDPNHNYSGDNNVEFDALHRQLRSNQQSLLNQLNPLDRLWNEHVASQSPLKTEKKSFPAMEIDPDLAAKIKRIGVPLWSLAGTGTAGALMQPDAANATPVEDQAMEDANGYAGGGRVKYIKDYLQKLEDLRKGLGVTVMDLADQNSPDYLKLLKDADWGNNLTLRDVNKLDEVGAGGHNTVNSTYRRNGLLLPDTELYRGLGVDKDSPFQERMPFAQSLTSSPKEANLGSRSLVTVRPSSQFPWLPNPFSGEDEFVLPEHRRLKLLSDDPTAKDLDVMRTDYSKGGEVASKLARLMSLLRSAPEATAPVAREIEPVAEKYTATGRSIPRDDDFERLQSLITNQPTDFGQYQWRVVKPGGEAHGAPFDYKGSALRVADTLNSTLPGHTVEALSVDNPAISRYVMRSPDPGANQLRKLDPRQVDRMLSERAAPNQENLPEPDDPRLAAGGSVIDDSLGFDGGGRVSGQSSPGSPGVGGAIQDALAAARDYFISRPARELAAERDEMMQKGINGDFDPIAHARERLSSNQEFAEGGEVKEDPDSSLSRIASLTDRLGGSKRFTVGVAKQLYGLDKEGKPAFGGRAWTQGQGGTPLGILDEIAAAPHNLLSLARTVRGLDPLRSRDSTYGGYQEGIDSLLDTIDPQWSKDASDRLDRLHEAVNQTSGIGDPHGLADHMTDAAASLVTPVPMTKTGEKAGLAKRLLEMTTPLRPRTGKNFATDTGVLGGVGYGIDELVNRLQRLKAEQQRRALPTSDPTQFSADMGVHPEEGTIYPEINRSAGMQPLPGGGQGIPPETF